VPHFSPLLREVGILQALEVNETAKEVAAQARVDAAFKKIPREVLEKKAVEQATFTSSNWAR